MKVRKNILFRNLLWALERVLLFTASLALLALLASSTALVASAQSQTIPVERLLNPDGTLNLSAGGSGALDLRGWDVTLDSLRGPILTRRRGGSEPLPIQAQDPHARSGTSDPAVPLAPTWQALPNNGLNDFVYALAVSGSDLYVGGNFTQSADTLVTNLSHIAKFSGGAWSALPHNGLNGTVYALAISGNDLYVGGNFTQSADGVVTNLNHIAKFSGGAWSALPNNGLNGIVSALAFISSDLYVGGNFTQSADTLVTNLNHIAKFSSGAWSALPHNGLNGDVAAFAVSGSDLYVGGAFGGTADGVVTHLNYIAQFSNGAWLVLPNNGLNGIVYALALTVSGSNLYVGGSFTQSADGAATNLNRIAKLSVEDWSWSPLPNNGLNGIVNALAFSGSDLYVGGLFGQTFDGTVTNLRNIAKFSGGAWSALPNNGLNSLVFALAAIGHNLYVGGDFTETFDGTVTNLNKIAKTMTAQAAGPICTVASSGADYTTVQAAVTDANCTTINIAAGTYNEHVTIGRSVTINGASASSTFVDGSNSGTVFTINSGTVTLSNLTIQHGARVGYSNFGGGVYNADTLNVTNSTVSNNSDSGVDGAGGGVYNSGTLNVTSSTFSGNSASGGTSDGAGGGVYNVGTLNVTNSAFSSNNASGGKGHIGAGGGVYNRGTLTVTSSTFSGNSATSSVDGGFGGGVANVGTLTVTNSTFSGNSASTVGGDSYGGGVANFGTLKVTNSTFSGNSASTYLYDGGGGIANCGYCSPVAIVTLRNTIVANSTSGVNCIGTITDGGGNLQFGGSGANSCGTFTTADPHLVALADNGGPTQTMALGANSAAVNLGIATTCVASVGSPNFGAGGKDQRGMNRGRSGFCDSGAFETQPASNTITGGGAQSAVITTAFAAALQVTVQDTNNNLLGGVVVAYTAPVSGASAMLSSNTATTNISGVASVTATANGTPGGPYNVAANAAGVSAVSFSLTNLKANTTTTITSHNPNPSIVGQAVTVNFSVAVNAPGSGTPTGNVTVSDGTDNCTGTLAAGTCNLISSTSGNKNIAANYNGDSHFDLSTAAVMHTVNYPSTGLTLDSSPNPSLFGQTVTFTATVSSSVGTPSGTVSFYDTLGSGPLSPTRRPFLSVPASSLSVTATTTALSAGTHSIVAVYSGDSTHPSMTSSALTQAVNNPVSLLMTATPSSAAKGGSAFTMTIVGTNFVPNSSVQWNGVGLTTAYDSGVQLRASVSAANITNNGVANITVFNPAPGGGTSNLQAFFINDTGAQITSSSTVSGTNPSATTGGSNGVTANATGNGTVTVGIYNANPGGTPPPSNSGAYMDVHVAPGNTFTSLTIVDCNLNGGTQVNWWNGSAWLAASNQVPNSPTAGCVTIAVNASTSPTLDQLKGTPFGAAVASANKLYLYLPLIVR